MAVCPDPRTDARLVRAGHPCLRLLVPPLVVPPLVVPPLVVPPLLVPPLVE
jgi:hypothetical protein